MSQKCRRFLLIDAAERIDDGTGVRGGFECRDELCEGLADHVLTSL